MQRLYDEGREMLLLGAGWIFGSDFVKHVLGL